MAWRGDAYFAVTQQLQFHWLINHLIAIATALSRVRGHNQGELAGKTAQRLKQLCFRRDLRVRWLLRPESTAMDDDKAREQTDPLTLSAEQGGYRVANISSESHRVIPASMKSSICAMAQASRKRARSIFSCRQTKRDVAGDRVVDEENILRT